MSKINFSSDTIRAGGDAKTVKGNGDEYITAIMYLAPWKQAVKGFNACSMAEIAGCIDPCLYKAGRGKMSNVQQARIEKTRRFVADRAAFMAGLAKDCARFETYCAKRNAKPVVRLNGTSDIRWELIKVEYNGTVYPNIFAAFPNIQFYDYTKIPNRDVTQIPNYYLLWSYSEASLKYASYWRIARANGMNIAVVFRDKALPKHFKGLPVINGDKDDLRFLDNPDSVVGLYAKGPAKKDTSGFVIRYDMQKESWEAIREV